jgi:uncharacterized protein (DUF362 family)
MKAMQLINDQFIESIKGKHKILIKPNFVSTRRQLAASHVDSVKAVLDILSKHHDGEVIIGEGIAVGNLEEVFSNFGYDTIRDEYGVEIIDLNVDEYVEHEGVDRELKPIKFHVSKTLLESDYLISVAKPKTHDCVIATLSIKNVVVGSLVSKNEKDKIHQGTKAININIAKLAQHCMPDLAIVDGFIGMEGEGPIDGDPVRLGVSSASLHPVSLDSVMAKTMGFEPLDIGYLYYLNEWGEGIADLDKIKVIGESINRFRKKFKPHPTYKKQLKWR